VRKKKTLTHTLSSKSEEASRDRIDEKNWMATARQNGSQSFESQFPIVATNLRALVSSWLPPARDPSPIDEETVDGEVAGRQERYRKNINRKVNEQIGIGS
jgi:hypothetical protein